jgi:DNA-binding XRE family transcriptional regulator
MRLGWTRRQLADRLMLSPFTVEGLEHDEHGPSLRVKRILAMIEREEERAARGRSENLCEK